MPLRTHRRMKGNLPKYHLWGQRWQRPQPLLHCGSRRSQVGWVMAETSVTHRSVLLLWGRLEVRVAPWASGVSGLPACATQKGLGLLRSSYRPPPLLFPDPSPAGPLPTPLWQPPELCPTRRSFLPPLSALPRASDSDSSLFLLEPCTGGRGSWFSGRSWWEGRSWQFPAEGAVPGLSGSRMRITLRDREGRSSPASLGICPLWLHGPKRARHLSKTPQQFGARPGLQPRCVSPGGFALQSF